MRTWNCYNDIRNSGHSINFVFLSLILSIHPFSTYQWSWWLAVVKEELMKQQGPNQKRRVVATKGDMDINWARSISFQFHHHRFLLGDTIKMQFTGITNAIPCPLFPRTDAENQLLCHWKSNAIDSYSFPSSFSFPFHGQLSTTIQLFPILTSFAIAFVTVLFIVRWHLKHHPTLSWQSFTMATSRLLKSENTNFSSQQLTYILRWRLLVSKSVRSLFTFTP